jgi:hypothetical protein
MLTARRKAVEAKGAAAWKPINRQRELSAALRAYAAATTSATRDVSQLEKKWWVIGMKNFGNVEDPLLFLYLWSV